MLLMDNKDSETGFVRPIHTRFRGCENSQARILARIKDTGPEIASNSDGEYEGNSN